MLYIVIDVIKINEKKLNRFWVFVFFSFLHMHSSSFRFMLELIYIYIYILYIVKVELYRKNVKLNNKNTKVALNCSGKKEWICFFKRKKKERASFVCKKKSFIVFLFSNYVHFNPSCSPPVFSSSFTSLNISFPSLLVSMLF